MQDIRWKQRFKNFEKAFLKFEESLKEEDLSELEENGLIQRFEFTIELAWKTLKDYIEEEGIIVKSPKETIREAHRLGYIEKPQGFIDAFSLRNKLSHDYDGEIIEDAIEEIREEIYPIINDLFYFLKGKISDGNQLDLFDE